MNVWVDVWAGLSTADMVPEIMRKSEADERLMAGQLKHAWEPWMRELYGCEGRFDGRLYCMMQREAKTLQLF